MFWSSNRGSCIKRFKARGEKKDPRAGLVPPLMCAMAREGKRVCRERGEKEQAMAMVIGGGFASCSPSSQ